MSARYLDHPRLSDWRAVDGTLYINFPQCLVLAMLTIATHADRERAERIRDWLRSATACAFLRGATPESIRRLHALASERAARDSQGGASNPSPQVLAAISAVCAHLTPEDEVRLVAEMSAGKRSRQWQRPPGNWLRSRAQPSCTASAWLA